MITRCRCLMVFCLALLLLSAAGCGESGPELAEVTGLITLDGQPLPHMNISFRPISPSGTESAGGTNDQGVYKLLFTRDKTGAMPGDYNVFIEPVKFTKSDLKEMKDEGRPLPVVTSLPKKYSAPGALTAKVTSGGLNTIDFKLESK